MGATYFASDVHLVGVDDPAWARFRGFLGVVRRDGTELYLLGDVFEAWLGDDDDEPLVAAVAAELAALSEAGIEVSFAHGNRDFLVGHAFAARAGLRLMDEVEVLGHAGRRIALLHGDTLCTDDLAYQQLRTQFRHPGWQAGFLKQPLAARRAFAAQARAQSRAHTAMAAAEIMDVNQDAVATLFESSGADWIIHGHTHRPAVHPYGSRRRIVLGEWSTHPSWLRIAADGSAVLVHGGFEVAVG
jgi:UDP-2,3-diacylglucosamine hydrolase